MGQQEALNVRIRHTRAERLADQYTTPVTIQQLDRQVTNKSAKGKQLKQHTKQS